MLLKKKLVVCVCLLLSMPVFSWGAAMDQVVSPKWDLWGDADTSLPAGEAATESPAQQPLAETPAAVVEDTPPQDVSREESTPGRVDGPSPVSDVAARENVADTSASVPTVSPDDYLIGSGDILDISVWKDEALSRTLVVLPDGTVTFPLIGKIEVSGKTVAQVKNRMEKDLLRFVPELELTIEVKQSNSMIVYVIGRVNSPGRQLLNTNVDVLQALAMAGGPNPFARRNGIKIFRKDGDSTKVLPFRYSDVVDGDLATNIVLKRGDVIVVP